MQVVCKLSLSRGNSAFLSLISCVAQSTLLELSKCHLQLAAKKLLKPVRKYLLNLTFFTGISEIV